jgi:hypothetical protein
MPYAEICQRNIAIETYIWGTHHWDMYRLFPFRDDSFWSPVLGLFKSTQDSCSLDTSHLPSYAQRHHPYQPSSPPICLAQAYMQVGAGLGKGDSHEQLPKLTQTRCSLLAESNPRYTTYVLLDSAHYPPAECKDLAKQWSTLHPESFTDPFIVSKEGHQKTLVRIDPWRLKLERARRIMDKLPEPEIISLDRAVNKFRGMRDYSEDPVWYFMYGVPPNVVKRWKNERFGALDATVSSYALEAVQGRTHMAQSFGDEMNGTAFLISSLEQEHRLLMYMTSCFEVREVEIQLCTGSRVQGYSFRLASCMEDSFDVTIEAIL